jgi:hypothetical protein
MIDFDLSVRLRIGGADYDSESNPSFLSRIKTNISDRFNWLYSFIDFLKNDVEEHYRFTFDEGNDAYMLLYDRNFPEGFYGNSNNSKDWFYKQYSEEGNSVAAFVIPEVYVQHSVQRMEGLQMTPTDTLRSVSVAEIYLVNCDESNIDPYIELKVSYSQFGIATVWYGRNSKFKVIPEYFAEFTASLSGELASITEWLENNPDEEPDPIDIVVIQNREERIAAVENNNRRKRRRVQSNRD